MFEEKNPPRAQIFRYFRIKSRNNKLFQLMFRTACGRRNSKTNQKGQFFFCALDKLLKNKPKKTVFDHFLESSWTRFHIGRFSFWFTQWLLAPKVLSEKLKDWSTKKDDSNRTKKKPLEKIGNQNWGATVNK